MFVADDVPPPEPGTLKRLASFGATAVNEGRSCNYDFLSSLVFGTFFLTQCRLGWRRAGCSRGAEVAQVWCN